jgi:hypothetical protein
MMGGGEYGIYAVDYVCIIEGKTGKFTAGEKDKSGSSRWLPG